MITSITLAVAIIILLIAAFVVTVIPVFPGALLTLGAVGIYIAQWGMNSLGKINFWLIVVFCVLYMLADLIAGVYSVKKFGGGKYGIIGSILGGIVGALLFSLPGLILGSIFGGAILEFAASKNVKQSLKVAAGALFGFFLGTFGKLLILAVATVIFVWGVLF
ncbi:MAG: hypothetical protein CEN90_214 [Parcubacteria group bacterium Licking1014_17]|nr:MAG: hypothetical protein CEN90_214 [Parcubacteria group bacterium Licking1014_17]